MHALAAAQHALNQQLTLHRDGLAAVLSTSQSGFETGHRHPPSVPHVSVALQ